MRHRALLRWLCLVSCLLLWGCAQVPPAPPPQALFEGAAFEAPSERISADDVFALSDAMVQYLRTDIGRQLRDKGPQAALTQALYQRGGIRLDYDARRTRNASEAFEARTGNCLSLVIMTAAFAKALNLQVTYQSALRQETWSRNASLMFRSGHVNVTLGPRLLDLGIRHAASATTIDFLPPDDLRGLRTVPISEATVLAMYMNNRAAEALAEGRLADAHGWAREAIRQSPAFLSAYNTLGVIYLRHGDAQPAERIFRHVLGREPEYVQAMVNLLQVLQQQGRTAESEALRRDLARIEPVAPFHFYELGLAAMRQHDYAGASDWFEREAARDGHYHALEFWRGVAYFKLGDLARAHRHLARALENSTNSDDRDLYAAKLTWLRAHERSLN